MAKESAGSARRSRLARGAGVIVAVEAVALLVLGILGLVRTRAASPAQVPGEVAGFQVNLPHSLLLIGTAVLGLVALAHPRMLRWFAAAQAAVYLALFVSLISVSKAPAGDPGSPRSPYNLNLPDLVLYGALFVVGLTLVLLLTSALPVRSERRS